MEREASSRSNFKVSIASLLSQVHNRVVRQHGAGLQGRELQQPRPGTRGREEGQKRRGRRQQQGMTLMDVPDGFSFRDKKDCPPSLSTFIKLLHPPLLAFEMILNSIAVAQEVERKKPSVRVGHRLSAVQEEAGI